ncbi:helix-turn-helix transcriptional regulator [Thalassotalea sp. LPB0316]|uniref:PadR family transcriptional regulator n=1 Tax=Thalassotalea sp. LPB0316 TaxID=2769490 RepID=UPI0018679377|nr:PadR family transcriptional regulator [Thalassotalea sp. LPB0316]QOL25331.1 helix-turn-helix transcriptional regulator [Thalassotalea sp. LPB0316]
MDLPKDMVAASSTPLVLAILNKGDSYGYDIIAQVKTLSCGEMQWADGMLYPIMHRLEKKALIQSYWGQSSNGRKRKYYQITALGQSELMSLTNKWRKLNEMLQSLVGEEHV